ncbi:hypothetical protein llap_9844 [Limosa lapponica baueri]|uniref:Uncharacterized protein n=1 Tax=Limosa lapponica baueri TaxID=1758121 RepID=A0A2I0U187_LIMLA|nr:hypothetical protein llap_9844 [Limosa lapponica baueri]
MEKTMVRQAVPLQPMEDIVKQTFTLQPMENLTPEQVGVAKRKLEAEETLCRTRLLAGIVACGEEPIQGKNDSDDNDNNDDSDDDEEEEEKKKEKKNKKMTTTTTQYKIFN